MRHPNSLQNLRTHNRTGPSPYALKVLRALLKKPMRLPQIVDETQLDQRTVQAQITALLASECVYVADRVCVRPFSGPWAVYAPAIVRVSP